jgi:hypothetical protein
MRTLRIKAGPHEFRARLEQEKAPVTCEAFTRLLPFEKHNDYAGGGRLRRRGRAFGGDPAERLSAGRQPVSDDRGRDRDG